MEKGKKVLVAGHICLDIAPAFPSALAGKLEKIFVPGKLTNVGRAAIHTGGAVANTGLAMHFFGADVRLLGKVGRDPWGSLIRRALEGRGCDLRLREDEEAGTAYSVVIAVPGADRIFLHDPGANSRFTDADVQEEDLADVGHVHFGYPPLMEKMYAEKGEALLCLFQKVKRAGCTASLDMAAIDPESPAAGADWPEILSRVLPLVDYFVPSAEELCFMLDRERLRSWEARAAGGDPAALLTPEDVEPLADRLLDMGAAELLIKCGVRGLYYADRQTRGFERSFRPEKLVSAAGAGDSCIAAFLTARLSGQSLKDSAQLAAGAGACCVSAYDALSGLLPLEEIQRRIQNGWERQGA